MRKGGKVPVHFQSIPPRGSPTTPFKFAQFRCCSLSDSLDFDFIPLEPADTRPRDRCGRAQLFESLGSTVHKVGRRFPSRKYIEKHWLVIKTMGKVTSHGLSIIIRRIDQLSTSRRVSLPIGHRHENDSTHRPTGAAMGSAGRIWPQ